MLRILLLLLLLPLRVFSQTEKGVTPVEGESSIVNPKSSITRAVVVGISDYEDPAIPDLRFADRDAEAFAAWLRSPTGGSLGPGQLRPLLNDQATLGNLYKELEWLVDNSGEGDRAIIYFSGHGDIEARTRRKEGFLLCYNSPPNNYRTNAFAVYWLQDIIERLSLDKKARVLVITDACRAGKLAGQEINGAQLTTAALQEQFSNEVKILSCQPNEYSIEGVQWGGGRGVFSYHLTDGLYGLADRDADHTVQLREIGRYLEDRVPVQTDPMPQNPVVVGDRATVLALVEEAALAEYKIKKEQEQLVLSPTGMKGIEEPILAAADSSIRAIYRAFWAALERKDLMAPAGKSANDYYEILIRAPEMAPLAGLLKRNFAAALIDEAQSVTNRLLKTDPNVVSDTWSRPFVFDHIPAHLARATELLGERHYLYMALKAKQLFFEAKTYRTDNYPGMSPDSVLRTAVGKMENALTYDSNAAYIYVDLGFIYWYKSGQKEKALACAKQALNLSPNWVYAHYLAGNCYRNNNLSLGAFHLHKALELDSTFLLPYQELSLLYLMHGDQEKCAFYGEKYIQKAQEAIAAKPEAVPLYYRTLLGAELWKAGRTEEASQVLQEVVRLSNYEDWVAYQYLCPILADLGQYEASLQAAEKLSEYIPVQGYFGMGYAYQRLKQPAKAAEAFKKVVSLNPGDDPFWFYSCLDLAEWYSKTGLQDSATALFQQIIEWNWPPYFFTPLVLNFTGRAYWGLGKKEAMETTIQQALGADPENPDIYYNAACVYSVAGLEREALECLEKALVKGLVNARLLIRSDLDMDPIRESAGFKALLKKYLPDQVKD